MEARKTHLQINRLQKQKISQQIAINKIELELLNYVSKIESKILRLQAKIVRDKGSDKQIAVWEKKINVLELVSLLAAYPNQAHILKNFLMRETENNTLWKKSESKLKPSTTEILHDSVTFLISEYHTKKLKLAVIINEISDEFLKVASNLNLKTKLDASNSDLKEEFFNFKNTNKFKNKFGDIFIVDDNEFIGHDDDYKSINGYLEYNMFQPLNNNTNNILMIENKKDESSENSNHSPLLLTYPK